jgi:hypothetical protein
MNERGEITFLGVLAILCFSSLVILSALEIERSFRRLKSRTTLLLCTKETKGELKGLIGFMGRANWGIKNLERVKLLSILFPTAGIATKSADEIKRGLQRMQDLRILYHFKTLSALHMKGCPLDPLLIQTPFEIVGNLLKRSPNGTVKMRSDKWEHHFFLRPYKIQLRVEPERWESPFPQIYFQAKDKPERSYFP